MTSSWTRATVAAIGLVGLVACAGSDDNASSPSVATSDAVSTEATAAPSPSTTETPAAAPSSPPSTPPSSDAPPSDYDFTAISPIVQDFVDEHDLNGAGLVIVDRDEGVVHDEYWGEFDADHVSLIASSSKMIVAGVLMHLDDAGLLEVDAPVADVADWGSGNPTITPAQLVSNSSGLPGLFPSPGYGPYVCQYVVSGTMQACAEAIFTSTGDDADVIPPDTEYRYGGAQWQVAGAVAEVASGKSWADLVEEIYVEPCGVDSLAFNNQWAQFGGGGFGYPTQFAGDPTTLAATDNPNMEGGAYITAPDYATLLLMHLRDGMCDDTQVLSPEALERMHSDRTVSTYGSDTAYGMGWWVDEAAGRITDPGAYGAVPWLDLDDGYGAYLVIEGGSGAGGQLAGLLYDIVEEQMTATD